MKLEEGRTSAVSASFGSSSTALTASAVRAPTSTFSFCRTGPAMPSSWRSSATSRWAGATSALRRSAARAWAAATASCDLTVKRSGCTVVDSTSRPRLRASLGRQMSSRGISAALFSLGIALALAFAATATAAPITIGQLPSSPPGYVCLNGPGDQFQINVASGNSYEVPPGYTTLVSWSTYSSLGSFEEFALRIFDRQSDTAYVVERQDGPRLLGYSQVNTFQADVPVGAGDIIGIEEVNGKDEPNACVFKTELEGDEYANATAVGVHDTGTYSTLHKYRVNVSAVLEKPPVLTLISPASGPTGGGTRVTLAGHDLTGTEEVRFGAIKAQFKVLSDDEIEATAPAASSGGQVDVTVSTAAGTTPKVDGDRFTYERPPVCACPEMVKPIILARCVVPKLKGKTLKAVRKSLRKADCELGRVAGAHRGRARVKKQGAKPGTLLAAGSKVSVRLSGG